MRYILKKRTEKYGYKKRSLFVFLKIPFSSFLFLLSFSFHNFFLFRSLLSICICFQSRPDHSSETERGESDGKGKHQSEAMKHSKETFFTWTNLKEKTFNSFTLSSFKCLSHLLLFLFSSPLTSNLLDTEVIWDHLLMLIEWTNTDCYYTHSNHNEPYHRVLTMENPIGKSGRKSNWKSNWKIR